MEKLQGKTLFSKFDIHHGYNNIQLAKEDRHKAAIQTCHGTYIPEVMYFRMCNAPAFFQRTMRNDFVPFLEQYKENAGQYMDDWWIATADDAEGRALHEEVQLQHLGSRVFGSLQSVRQLASYTHWYPTQNHSMDGPCKPTILLSATESEQMSGQRNQLHG